MKEISTYVVEDKLRLFVRGADIIIAREVRSKFHGTDWSEFAIIPIAQMQDLIKSAFSGSPLERKEEIPLDEFEQESLGTHPAFSNIAEQAPTKQ